MIIRIQIRLIAATLFVVLVCSLTAFAQDQEISIDDAAALLQSGKWEQAVEALTAITTRNPGNGVAWFQLGFAQHSLGAHDDAIASYTTMLEVMPNHPLAPVARYNVGCAHAKMGDDSAALDWLEKAADIGLPNRLQSSRMPTSRLSGSIHASSPYRNK